ncbi:MAG: hypothetical protein JXQ87_08920 [Bacteroidia bacterium]
MKILVLVTTLSALGSCIGDDDMGEVMTLDVPLNEADLALVPYRKGDKFTMKHSGGQSVTFSVLDDASSYHSYDPVWEWDINEDLVHFESKGYSIKGDFPKIELFISLYKDYELSWSDMSISDTLTRLSLSNASRSYHVLGDIDSLADNTARYKKKLIGNAWREDVYYSFDSTTLEFDQVILPLGIWYNPKSGFLKLTYNNGDSLVIE